MVTFCKKCCTDCQMTCYQQSTILLPNTVTNIQTSDLQLHCTGAVTVEMTMVRGRGSVFYDYGIQHFVNGDC